MRLLVPLIVGLVFLGFWELLVRASDIPPFVLPAPSVIAESLAQNFGSLMTSLWATLRVTLAAFLLAVVGGIGLATIALEAWMLIEAFRLFPKAKGVLEPELVEGDVLVSGGD